MSIEYPKEKNFPIVRHGEIQDLGILIEHDQKPPYEDLIAFWRGESDPPINVMATNAIIECKITEGGLDLSRVNSVVTSDTLRARQTGELLARRVGLGKTAIHAVKYFNEVKLPIHVVSGEEYDKIATFSGVRNKVFGAFLKGLKEHQDDEGLVEAYKRALRAREYLKKVTVLAPNTKPLIVMHGFFGRIFQIAVEHGHEQWTDEEIIQHLPEEFRKTARPGNISGMNVKVVVDKNHQRFEIVSII
jgi:hypothetical protein